MLLNEKKLSQLLALSGLEGRLEGDPLISSVTSDSRKVQEGSLFVAISGERFDGHDFLEIALEQGAVALVVQQGRSLPPNISSPLIEVKDTRLALALLSAALYGPLPHELGKNLMGITGTNGKTTTSYLLESILTQAGFRAGILGTIAYRVGDVLFPAPLTTPSPELLWEKMLAMAEAGATHLVMEVSSHALHQHRVSGLQFSVVGFTNLSQDHLDYHGTMEAYLAEKLKLFSRLVHPHGRAVVNLDDPVGRHFIEASLAPVWTYSAHKEKKADIQLVKSHCSLDGMELFVEAPFGKLELRTSLVGDFNISNILLAVGMAAALGISNDIIESGISALSAVPGRLELVPHPFDFKVFVDYAHTPDALEKVIETLKPLCRGRLIVVFGCGGDRDKEKRPLMGAAVAQRADITILTSDNPRTEDPEVILEQTLEGVTPYQKPLQNWKDTTGGYHCCLDRKRAIGDAVEHAQKGDIILVAGKGHENYQLIGTKKYPFDDRKVLKDALEERKRLTMN